MKLTTFIFFAFFAFVSVTSAQNSIRTVDFQNFTYNADYCAGEKGNRKITVKDGKFFEEKKVDDYTERMFFSVYGLTFGDLDGDSEEEAVILSICNMGGTGNFSEAYIYKMVNGKPVRKLTLVGGDRAFGGLRKAIVRDGLLVVESSDAGKYGGACCAEYVVTNSYRFNGKTLKEVGDSTKRELYPAKRVSFDRGAYGKRIRVKMSRDEQRKRFKLGAAAGQTLIVTSSDPDVKLRLRSGDAQVLEENNSLVAKLKKNGDVLFEADQYTDTEKEFTLSITVKTPGYSYVKPPSGKIESIYTDLSAEKCKTLEADDSGAGSYIGECKGVGGFKLHLIEGDIRQTLNVIEEGSGDKWELDLWSVVSPTFSSLGNKAEWRVKRVNGQVVPHALIVRYNASENPEDSSKHTSYLVVTKIVDEFICVTDIVKPKKGQNLIARKLADSSRFKPCRKRR